MNDGKPTFCTTVTQLARENRDTLDDHLRRAAEMGHFRAYVNFDVEYGTPTFAKDDISIDKLRSEGFSVRIIPYFWLLNPYKWWIGEAGAYAIAWGTDSEQRLSKRYTI
jgi:hypothetical protein